MISKEALEESIAIFKKYGVYESEFAPIDGEIEVMADQAVRSEDEKRLIALGWEPGFDDFVWHCYT